MRLDGFRVEMLSVGYRFSENQITLGGAQLGKSRNARWFMWLFQLKYETKQKIVSSQLSF